MGDVFLSADIQGSLGAMWEWGSLDDELPIFASDLNAQIGPALSIAGDSFILKSGFEGGLRTEHKQDFRGRVGIFGELIDNNMLLDDVPGIGLGPSLSIGFEFDSETRNKLRPYGRLDIGFSFFDFIRVGVGVDVNTHGIGPFVSGSFELGILFRNSRKKKQGQKDQEQKPQEPTVHGPHKHADLAPNQQCPCGKKH